MMAQFVVPLGVVTVGARAIGRERPRGEHAEHDCRQKNSHELSHTDLSLFRSERYVSMFELPARRPHDTARRTRR
jgi:hypothetical protein